VVFHVSWQLHSPEVQLDASSLDATWNRNIKHGYLLSIENDDYLCAKPMVSDVSETIERSYNPASLDIAASIPDNAGNVVCGLRSRTAGRGRVLQTSILRVHSAELQPRMGKIEV